MVAGRSSGPINNWVEMSPLNRSSAMSRPVPSFTRTRCKRISIVMLVALERERVQHIVIHRTLYDIDVLASTIDLVQSLVPH